MASDLSFIEFVVEQMANAGEITYRKMFGEYGLYCDGIIMALICNDQLFAKPTEAGRAFIDELAEAPPYPGAKPYFLIEDRFDDREWLSTLIRVTVKELSEIKPKPKKKNQA